MTYVAILLVMLVSFTIVGWPLIRSSSRVPRREVGEGSPWDDLIGRRDAAYRAIKELDFEHELGNLSESDYEGLRERYRSEAAVTLRKLDAAAGGGSQAAPSGPSPSSEVASAVPPQTGLACPSCGKATETADHYCWSCGARLEVEG